MKSIAALLTIGITILIFSALPAAAASDHGKMDHGGMSGSAGDMGFKHESVEDGVRSEFQIMSLASMNMKDDQGATHHIMVKLIDENTRAEIKDAVGKIKVVGPDGVEQEGALKNYGGILAANFNFDKPGKYGVICLYKVGDRKQVVKFWYHHQG